MTTSRHGIPTEYKNCTFRSRNEARWAVFFDAIGWQWEYEPFDSDGYIPDFAIIGPWPMLVEVKPDTAVAKLDKYAEKVIESVAGQWEDDILILGSTPLPFIEEITFGSGYSAMGLLFESMAHEEVGRWSAGGAAIWARCDKCGRVSVFHDFMSWTFRPGCCGDGNGKRAVVVPTDETESLWRLCSDVVRWRP